MHVVYETETRHDGYGLSTVAAQFAGQIATAVCLRKLTDAAAREALWSFATACHPGTRRDATGLLEALTAEYSHRRERLDLCS